MPSINSSAVFIPPHKLPMKKRGLLECSLNTLALSVATNEEMGSHRRTILTLALCINRHNPNLPHLLFFGQLKRGEKVRITSWNCFLFRHTGFGLYRPRQQQSKPVWLMARLFAMCCTDGIYLPYIYQIWLSLKSFITCDIVFFRAKG